MLENLPYNWPLFAIIAICSIQLLLRVIQYVPLLVFCLDQYATYAQGLYRIIVEFEFEFRVRDGAYT